MAETFFITTAIDYTNGAPHIGHAYEKVLADVLARYHRLKGDDVFFLTGVDQHGQKVQQSAEKAGVAPQQYVDGITAKFLALWDKLDVRYSQPSAANSEQIGWVATTDPKHKKCVQDILQRLWDEKGADGQSRWIYKKSQRGFYSVRQEQFLTDKERGPDGEFGPEWGLVEERDEENYYFRLTAHPSLPIDPKQWLLDLIRSRRGGPRPVVIPDFRNEELLNAVEKLDGDLCITRPKARLSWGIEVPFDPDFVTFVWFDALVNYISFAPGYDPKAARPPEAFLQWWRSVVHVIGKDILIPAHGVYWPIMLKALGFEDAEIPQLLVHGWWNIRGKGGESEKMSKSLGNVVDPDVLADKYGAEAVRYYLMSDIATGKDADFSEERLIQRFNTDLANSLGNLLNRTLNMAAKYREGKVSKGFKNDAFFQQPRFWYHQEGSTDKFGADRVQMADKLLTIEFGIPEFVLPKFTRASDQFAVNIALENALVIAGWNNELVDVSAPWKLAKLPDRQSDLDAVLYTLAESLRIIAILLSPVLPKAAHGIFDQLNWKMELSPGRERPPGVPHLPEATERSASVPYQSEARFHLADAVWGLLPDGHPLGAPTPLFPRIEVPKEA